MEDDEPHAAHAPLSSQQRMASSCGASEGRASGQVGAGLQGYYLVICYFRSRATSFESPSIVAPPRSHSAACRFESIGLRRGHRYDIAIFS